MNRYQESWFEAVVISIAVVILVIGVAAPAPVLLFGVVDQIGQLNALAGSIALTVLWLGLPYVLFVYADRIKENRISKKTE